MFDSPQDLAARIDLAFLRPEATPAEVKDLCLRAREAGFAAVVLLPCHLQAAAGVLDGSPVALCAAVAFPLGAATLPVKMFEALQCELLGARELDIVLDHSAVRARDRRALRKEIASITSKTPDLLHKFILEMGTLEEAELRPALKAIGRAGPDYIKTGTGTRGPVTPEQVRRLRKDLDRRIRIKAAGGVRTLEELEALVEAGADRVGTSAGFEILEAWEASRRAG